MPEQVRESKVCAGLLDLSRQSDWSDPEQVQESAVAEGSQRMSVYPIGLAQPLTYRRYIPPSSAKFANMQALSCSFRGLLYFCLADCDRGETSLVHYEKQTGRLRGTHPQAAIVSVWSLTYRE